MVLNAAAILLLLFGPAPQPGAASPIQVEAISLEAPDGLVRAWVARVDLTDPRVSFVVTGPLEQRDGVPASTEAKLIPTDAWAEKEGVDLAVNAGFFARVDGGIGAPRGWTDGLPVDIVGLSRSDGRTVSPSRQGGRDVALLIDETVQGRSCPCTVRAGDASEADLAGIEDAVAGGSSREGDPGTPLVVNGENHGATAQVEPDRGQPRRRGLFGHVAPGARRPGRPRPQPPQRWTRATCRQPPRGPSSASHGRMSLK